MRVITEEIGKTIDGIRLVRNYFMYDDDTNYLLKAQSNFTKDERKEAKINHRKSLKTFSYNDKRDELIRYLVSQDIPNWNVKIGILKN